MILHVSLHALLVALFVAPLTLLAPLHNTTQPTTQPAAQPADQPDADDWTPLFDGKTLDGFVTRGGAAVYSVEDNAIVGETRPNTPNTFLCTEREYADFVLEFEVLVHPELNSGVQIRSHVKDGDRVFGYQVEIDPTARGFSGGIYDEARRGWLAQPTPQQAAEPAFKADDWNHYRVEARGHRIRTWINDVPVADLIDDADASGLIGFQVHGVGGRNDPLEVRWRNLRIRELD